MTEPRTLYVIDLCSVLTEADVVQTIRGSHCGACRLRPASVDDLDIEAAAIPATDSLAMFAAKMLGITHEEAMGRADVVEAGRLIAEATLRAALGGTDEA